MSWKNITSLEWEIMGSRVYISSSVVPCMQNSEKVDVLSRLGARNIELSGGGIKEENLAGKLKNIARERGISFLVHNYFPPPSDDFVLNIVSPSVDDRNKSFEFVKKSINMAVELGSPLYSFHPGYLSVILENSGIFSPVGNMRISFSKGENIFFKQFDVLHEYAVEKGIKLAVENLFSVGKDNFSIFTEPESINRLLKYLSDKENGGILIDLGHLYVSESMLGFSGREFLKYLLCKYADKIFEIHISGNYGKSDSHLPLSDDMMPVKYLKLLKEINVPITIECRNVVETEIFKEIEFVKNIIGE